MLIIPDAVRFLIAAVYLVAGLALFNIVIRGYRFKLGVGLFDTLVASFIGLFCFSASVLMLTVV